MVRFFPESEILLEIGHVAMVNGLLDEAYAIMDSLSSIDPDAPHPRTGRALSSFMLGRLQQAIDDLSETVNLFPQAVFARALLARFMKQVGDPTAEDMAISVLEMNPPDFVADIARDVIGEFRSASDASISSNAESGDARESVEGSSAYPPGFRGTVV